jgi:hypothetical protein
MTRITKGSLIFIGICFFAFGIIFFDTPSSTFAQVFHPLQQLSLTQPTSGQYWLYPSSTIYQIFNNPIFNANINQPASGTQKISTWAQASSSCASLGGGYHLPTLSELYALLNNDYVYPTGTTLNSFTFATSSQFWTSNVFDGFYLFANYNYYVGTDTRTGYISASNSTSTTITERYFCVSELGSSVPLSSSSQYVSILAMTSTFPTVISGFTYGEIVNGIFLFLLLTVAGIILYHLIFRHIKIKS